LIDKVKQNSIYLKQIFCFNNAKVFTDTSDQFSTSLLNNKVLKKKNLIDLKYLNIIVYNTCKIKCWIL